MGRNPRAPNSGSVVVVRISSRNVVAAGGMRVAFSCRRNKGSAMTTAPTKIMVATDFSPTAKDALEYGRMLAERLGASLHLVHVCEQSAMVAAWTEAHPQIATGQMEVAKKIATDRIASFVVPSWTCPVTTEVVCGAPAPMIVELARARGVSMIVMGTHGYGIIKHMVLGSVAERVVRTAHCPVLTIRHPDEASRSEARQSMLSTAI